MGPNLSMESRGLTRCGMRGRATVVFCVAMVIVMSSTAAGGYPRPGRTEEIPPSSTGIPHSADAAAISGNGRFVAFVSSDPTIVTPDVNPGRDVFLHDRRTQRTKLISVSSSGSQGVALQDCAAAVMPAISATGRFVAFESAASNLVAGDTNEVSDVFVYDRKKATTKLVSRASNGDLQNDGYCEVSDAGPQDLSMSADGGYVSFISPADNLVKRDTNEATDVFVRDLKQNETTRVSVSSQGNQASGESACTAMNATGRFVGFTSIAGNLVEDDTNGVFDTFIHDRRSGRTTSVSVASDGTEASALGGGGVQCRPGNLFGPPHVSMSADGRFVTFAACAGNLIPSDQPPLGGTCDVDIFVHDRRTGRTERVSVTSNGEEATGGFSVGSAISRDGRFVAFASHAKNLYPDDDETFLLAFGDSDVFVHDRVTGATEMLSVSPEGDDGTCRDAGAVSELDDVIGAFSEEGYAALSSMSGDGRFVSFISCDINLVDGAGGPLPELGLVDRAFVRDRGSRLGVGSLIRTDPQDGGIVVPAPSRSSRPAVAHFSKLGGGGEGDLLSGAGLIGGRVVYRPVQEDLFVALEVDGLQGFRPRIDGKVRPPMVYGMRFTMSGLEHEIRAAAVGGNASFGLFRCTPRCKEIAKLSGGYGTSGESVTLTIPLEHLGLGDGGEVHAIQAFSGLGTYTTGAIEVLDTMGLTRNASLSGHLSARPVRRGT